MDRDTAQTRLLDAAEKLFYKQGVKAVGMAAIRDASGVPLRTLYQVFSSKELLVAAYLERHDVVWRQRLDEDTAFATHLAERWPQAIA